MDDEKDESHRDVLTAAGRLKDLADGVIDVEPPYMALAVVDVVTQVARQRLLEIDEDQHWGLGFGWPDLVNAARDREDVELRRLVKRMRSDAYRVEAGKQDAFDRLASDAATFVRTLGGTDDAFVPELPTRTEIVNTLAVETPTGFRTFELGFGYVSLAESDVIVASTHADESRSMRGPLLETLEISYGIHVDAERRLLSCDPTIWTLWQPVESPAPFGSVLVLRLEPPKYQDDPVEYYERALRTVFASLAALEHMGHAFPTVSIPTLAKKHIHGYEEAVAAIIENASRWLRVSRHTHTVRFFVSQGPALRLWNEAMNRRLGRSLDDNVESVAIAAMCEELHTILSRHRDGDLGPAVTPLLDAVSKPGMLALDNISVFGRKLVELLVERALKDLRVKRSGNLLDNTERLRESGRVAPWVCSYMHALRILGNRSVHSKIEGAKFMPLRPGSVDLLAALVAVRALTGFWEEWEASRAE